MNQNLAKGNIIAGTGLKVSGCLEWLKKSILVPVEDRSRPTFSVLLHRYVKKKSSLTRDS